jgi:hypothetical protein
MLKCSDHGPEVVTVVAGPFSTRARPEATIGASGQECRDQNAGLGYAIRPITRNQIRVRAHQCAFCPKAPMIDRLLPEFGGQGLTLRARIVYSRIRRSLPWKVRRPEAAKCAAPTAKHCARIKLSRSRRLEAAPRIRKLELPNTGSGVRSNAPPAQYCSDTREAEERLELISSEPPLRSWSTRKRFGLFPPLGLVVLALKFCLSFVAHATKRHKSEKCSAACEHPADETEHSD